MAITLNQKDKFIELRAQGLSFDSISDKLNISKPTLIKLQLELNNEISNVRYLIYESLVEKYKLTIKHKVDILCKEIDKINQEIDKKDFSCLSLKELILIREKLQVELNEILGDIFYHTDKYQAPNFDELDLSGSEIKIPLY